MERTHLGGCITEAAKFFFCPCCIGYLGMTSRRRIIDKYTAQGVRLEWQGDISECLQWCLCSVCSVCQEYRTVMNHVDVNGDWVKVETLEPPGQMTQPVAIPQPVVELEMEQPSTTIQVEKEGQEEALPPTGVMPLMPPGWVTELDAKGKTYYYNAELQQSTYEHPSLSIKHGADEHGGGRSCCGL